MLVTPIHNRIAEMPIKNNKTKQTERQKQNVVSRSLCYKNITFGYGAGLRPGGIFDAAYRGNLELVQSRLDRGVDVNLTDQSGKTPLHYAVECGSKKVVEYLLTRGDIDISIRDYKGKTAKDIADEYRYEDIQQLFDEFKARKGESINKTDPKKFLKAAEQGDIQTLEEELKKGVDINAHSENQKYTALMLAASWNRLVALEYLLSQDGIDVNAQALDGRTAMMIAAKFRNTGIVRTLLDREDIDIAYVLDICNLSAYSYADMYLRDVDNTLVERIKDLRDYQLEHPESIVKNVSKQKIRTDNQQVDIDKLSAKDNIWTEEEISREFGKLIAKKEYKNAEKMLERTPFIDFEADSKKLLSTVGKTGNPDLILKSADYIFHKQAEMKIKYEKERKDFFDNVSNKSYSELKESNVIINTKDGFKILMGKEEFNPNDTCGRASLFADACRIDPSGELAEAILSKYGDVKIEESVYKANNKLKKLIDNYKGFGKFKISLSKPETVDRGLTELKEYVLSENFNPKNADEMGNNLLHISAAVNNDKARGVMERLIGKGIDVNSKNVAGQTPLMRAIKQLLVPRSDEEKTGILSNIKFLIDKGSDINEQDANGQTAFHYACMTSSIALLNLILSKDPNVFLKDAHGNPPSKYLKTVEMQNMFKNYLSKLL